MWKCTACNKSGDTFATPCATRNLPSELAKICTKACRSGTNLGGWTKGSFGRRQTWTNETIEPSSKDIAATEETRVPRSGSKRRQLCRPGPARVNDRVWRPLNPRSSIWLGATADNGANTNWRHSDTSTDSRSMAKQLARAGSGTQYEPRSMTDTWRWSRRSFRSRLLRFDHGPDARTERCASQLTPTRASAAPSVPSVRLPRPLLVRHQRGIGTRAAFPALPQA
jgi:hypothetical protein